MPFRRDRSSRTSLTASDRCAFAWLLGALGLSAAALGWFAPMAQAQVNFTGPTNIVTAPAGFGAGSVAAGDFNGDSDPDLAVPDFDSVKVLLGGPGGSFTGPTSFDPGRDVHEVAVGDFDLDSDADLAATHFDGVDALFGTGAGGFTLPSTEIYGVGLARPIVVGHFNADSDLDLAVGLEGNNSSVRVLLGGPGGTFTGPAIFAAGVAVEAIAVGDFNADSKADLALANRNGDSVEVLVGAGDGSFAVPVSIPVGDGPSSIAVGQFNADSDPDLAVANGFSDNVSVLLGGAGASFTALPTTLASGDGPFRIAVGDLDGDSDDDLAVSNAFLDTVSVFLGAANASFTGPTSFPTGDGPGAIAMRDLDADSDLDLAIALGGGTAGGGVSVLLNIPLANNPPTADADAYTTAQDTPLTVPAPGVLGNDSDPDGDTLTASVNTGPAHGMLTLHADGSFTYTPAAGYSGPDSFTYRAGDGAASSAPTTVTITVTAAPVVFSFTGFFSPVDNLPTLNSTKAGSSVPVKFSLAGDQGLDIFAATYPKSENIACDSSALVDGIEETATPSADNTLQYDALLDQYTYVWKTEKRWAKTCRQLVVKLSDDTVHRANFQLR